MSISIKGEKRDRAKRGAHASSSLARTWVAIKAKFKKKGGGKGLPSKSVSERIGELGNHFGGLGKGAKPSGHVEWINTGESTARAVSVNGRRYVSNLLWQPLSGLSEAPKEIKSFLAVRQMNLYTTYEGTVLQAGFASVDLAQKKIYAGASSLAGAMCERESKFTWIAVLRVDEEYSALVAVNEGRIVPGCDRIGKRDELIELAGEIAGSYAWEKIYTDEPDTLEFFSGMEVLEITLAQMLSERAPGSVRIRLVIDRKKELIIGGVAAVLVLTGLVYGYNKYQERQKQRMRSQATEQNATVAEKRKFEALQKARAELEKSTLKPVWQEKPAALDWVKRCATAIRQMPINVGGWTLEDATCQGSDLIVKFKRSTEANIGDFAAQAKSLVATGKALSFFVEDAAASLRMDLKTSELKPRKPADLISAEEWRLHFVSRLQSLGAKYEYALTARAKVAQPNWVVEALGIESIERAEPWWNNYTWTFALAGLSAIDLLEHIGEAPGLTVDKISVSMSGPNAARWAWSASGEANVSKLTNVIPK